MKRYIRTNKGHIYKWLDTGKIWFGTPNICTKETTPLFADSEEKIIAESDYVYDLAQVGDLYSILLLIDMGEAITEETYEIANDNDLADFKENVKLANFIFNKLYTKQNGNYILVWHKERGVI